jgi:hypothetical protein
MFAAAPRHGIFQPVERGLKLVCSTDIEEYLLCGDVISFAPLRPSAYRPR